MQTQAQQPHAVATPAFSPAQQLRQHQQQIKDDAATALASFTQRITQFANEARELGEIDIFPPKARDALMQFGSMAHGTVDILSRQAPAKETAPA
jgi:hypothetical protein